MYPGCFTFMFGFVPNHVKRRGNASSMIDVHSQTSQMLTTTLFLVNAVIF